MVDSLMAADAQSTPAHGGVGGRVYAAEEGEEGAAQHAVQLQRGVVRTNCIDCLDRTNVAQFCIGRCFLQRQLRSLGYSYYDYDGGSAQGLEVANALLMRMYEEMGTQLALQYGGSQALNAPNSNAAKDFLQSVKRFYRNTFTDLEKQHIMDVFLGVYSPQPGRPHIWELESDLFLHNRPSLRTETSGDEGLEQVEVEIPRLDLSRQEVFDDFYRPSELSSFDDILSHSFVACAAHSTIKGMRNEPLDLSSASLHATPGAFPPRDAPSEATGIDGAADQDEIRMWGYDKPSSMLTDISAVSLGVVQLMLPQGYMNVDEWARRQDGFHQHATRAAELYASFLSYSELAAPLSVSEELDVYTSYLTGHMPPPLPLAPMSKSW